MAEAPNRTISRSRQFERTFEMLRGEDRLLERQSEGDEIDFDAVISVYADMHSSMELADRMLMKRPL